MPPGRIAVSLEQRRIRVPRGDDDRPKGKAAAAASTAAAGETEAQILPMMAKAAVEGGGSVEYDKYGQMLAQVKGQQKSTSSSSKAPLASRASTPASS